MVIFLVFVFYELDLIVIPSTNIKHSEKHYDFNVVSFINHRNKWSYLDFMLVVEENFFFSIYVKS